MFIGGLDCHEATVQRCARQVRAAFDLSKLHRRTPFKYSQNPRTERRVFLAQIVIIR